MACGLAETSAERLVAAIRRMIDADVVVSGLRPLGGGTGQRCFAVDVAGRTIVAKLADPDASTALPLEAEFRLLEHAASIGVAPEPIGIDQEASVLLYELVEAERWAAGDFHDTASIGLLAERLRMLHALPTGIRPYTPRRFAEVYVGLCRDSDRAQAEAASAELAALATTLDGDLGEQAVCHNDLHASNILRGTELLFIDFEYAVAAAPIVDLASIIAMNRLKAPQSEALIAAYYADRPAPFDDRALANVVRLQQLLAELWRLARTGQADERPSGVEMRSSGSGVAE